MTVIINTTPALGFHVEVGTIVVMTAPCLGCTHEDNEVETRPGAVGRVARVQATASGLAITVAIHAGQSEGTGEDLWIVNVFEDADPAPRFPFRRADVVVSDALASQDRLRGTHDAARAYDANLNRREVVPTGDDYNALFSIMMAGAEPDPVRDAAPNMLDALREASTFLAAQRAAGMWADDEAGVGEAVQAAVDAAIAKAEGRANG